MRVADVGRHSRFPRVELATFICDDCGALERRVVPQGFQKVDHEVPFKQGVFEPEVLAAAATAYDRACLAIQLGPCEGVAKEILAKRILEFARYGCRDTDQLYTQILRSFCG